MIYTGFIFKYKCVLDERITLHTEAGTLNDCYLKDYYLSGELEPILNSRQRTEERKLLERNKELCIRYYY